MEVSTKIFVLLTIFLKLVSGQNDCYNNTKYTNDESLVEFINGYLYNYETTAPNGNNEVFYFRPSSNDIYCRTTNDNYGGCCITLDIKKKPDPAGYYTYNIQTDGNCPMSLNQNATMKLLDANVDGINGCCIILWTCRLNREGVHTFCEKTQQSVEQQNWIKSVYDKYGLTPTLIQQNTVLETQPCLKYTLSDVREMYAES